MNLGQIYRLSIQLGIENDLRGTSAVKKHLQKHKEQYAKLSADQKKKFHEVILENPYPDSLINYGDPNTEVKKVLAGIDMEVGEVLLADRLGDIDLVIAHHPSGRAFAELAEVMHIQAEILANYGVPINIAQGIMEDRIAEVRRKFHAMNNFRTADTAKLLDIPFMCAHTVCDNMAASFIKNSLAKAKPETVGDIMEVLQQIPEYDIASNNGMGPMIAAGSTKSYCGKIAVAEFTGGTNGSHLIYEKMAHAGIGTVISMHPTEEGRKEAIKNHINLIVTGHMSSDSLGMNLFLDELEKKGVTVVPTSGLIRVSRNKKNTKKRRK